MTKQQSERDEFIARLRETLKPGDTLHTVLRSVSRSGMSRVIDVYHFHVKDGEVHKDWLSYWIAKACEFSFQDDRAKPEGIKVGGCGMDMGFHVVYTLGRVLWPEGSGIPCEHCGKRPQNQQEAKDATARHEYRGRNGDRSGWDNDGGYALHHEWF